MKQDVLAVHLSGWPDDLPSELFAVPHVGRGVPRALMHALIAFVVNVQVDDNSYQVRNDPELADRTDRRDRQNEIDG